MLTVSDYLSDVSSSLIYPQVCRICGCDEHHACVDPNGEGCYWAALGLCSVCADFALVMALWFTATLRAWPIWREARCLKAWTSGAAYRESIQAQALLAYQAAIA